MLLLWRKGFPSVTVRDFAGAMGIKRSSFYNSFGTREAVFKEVVERYARSAPDAPLDGFRPGRPAAPLLVAVFRRVCRIRAADSDGKGCLICNSITDLVGTHDELGPMLEGAWHRRIQTLEELLRSAADEGDLPNLSEPNAAAGSVAVFLLGLNNASRIDRREPVLWQMCQSFLASLGISDTLLNESEALCDALEVQIAGS